MNAKSDIIAIEPFLLLEECGILRRTSVRVESGALRNYVPCNVHVMTYVLVRTSIGAHELIRKHSKSANTIYLKMLVFIVNITGLCTCVTYHSKYVRITRGGNTVFMNMCLLQSLFEQIGYAECASFGRGPNVRMGFKLG